MKKLLGFVLFFVWIGQGYGQHRTTVNKPARLADINFSLGAGIRDCVDIPLPFGTIEWSYTFSTLKHKGDRTTFDFFTKIVSLYNPAVGLVLDNIPVSGVDVCNVWLTTPKGRNDFLDVTVGLLANSYTNSALERYEHGSHFNVSSAKYVIKSPLTGTNYVCFENTNVFKSIHLHIQAVAIVQEVEEDLSYWTNEGRSVLAERSSMKFKEKGASNADAKILSGLFVNSVTSNYLPSDMSAPQMRSKLDELVQELYDAHQAQKVAEAASIAEAKQEESKEEAKATLLGNMAWEQYEKGNIDKCIDLSLKALTHEELAFIYANLGLCYLVKGEEDKAVDAYMEAIEQLESEFNKKKTLKTAISRIEAAVRAKGELDGSKMILELLNQQLNRA